ncbi:MAG: putative AGC family protein kinase [Streblomastix strix]|uniref:non-specific serine/threonine protein kinase n=1 Tax=Streblomastix strix TaxID=222440 RepID=A0A5J4UCY6_9EUKA|nr:MAG: putative AGC family protein kinase [Streblomastix strix]
MREKAASLKVAVKEMDYESEAEKKMIHNEIAVMKYIYQIVQKSARSSFIHIVQPLGFFLNEEGDKVYIVMEYCSQGDLRKYINVMKGKGVKISPAKAYDFLGQIAVSLNQLHCNGIIHSDIKPENILLTEDFKVKLSDFGVARQQQKGNEYLTQNGGTFLYQAPEYLYSALDNEISPQIIKTIQTIASDIWAFGVTMFELLAQNHPFFDNKEGEDLQMFELIHRIVNSQPAALPDQYPLNLKNIIKRMQEKDPSRRITAEQILNIHEVAGSLNEK